MAGVTHLPGATKKSVETRTSRVMKTVLIILLTSAWLASWTGIALGFSGGLTPPAAASKSAVVVANR